MKRNDCRACGSRRLQLIYDFGPQPLAGQFPLTPESEQSARRYTLDLTQCDDCGLLQVTNLPPIEAVFHDDYRYSSSTVPSLVRHFVDYVDWIDARLPKGARILEFGCNDGVLLSRLRDRGFSCVGVDASSNVADLARAKGVEVHTAFMTEALVQERDLAGKHDLITCSNVFAHIDDVHATLTAVRAALKPNGVFVIEVHDAAALHRDLQFETIYHEHLTYFSELTLRRLVESEGFAFVECAKTPMHGGALRFMCRRSDSHNYDRSPTMNQSERIDGANFAAVIDRCAADIREAARRYGPLDGYGAAGRSQMFINVTKTADCFGRVFDDSRFRQDRYIVGTDIPIRAFRGDKGRACVILAWNYAPAIAERIRGGYEELLTVLPKRTRW